MRLFVGGIALGLRLAHREDDVAVGVVDRQHAGGADDADLEAVHRGRPGDRQRPRDVEMMHGAVGEHHHAGGGVDALVDRSQHLVDRACVDLALLLAVEAPHADVERMRAGDHHRRDRLRLVGALVVVDRDQPVHEGARCDQGYIPERAGRALLLGREPAAAEALGVADDHIELRALDRGEHAGGLREIRRQRLFDQHRQLVLDRAHDWIDVQVLVGRDDRAGRLQDRARSPRDDRW